MTIQRFRSQYGGMSFTDMSKLVRSSADFRGVLRSLYEQCFHDTLNGACINCWWDAYHVMTTSPIERLEKMQTKKFDLRAGCVLIDVVGHDNALTATRHNITDELALYHLRTHPEYISEFSKYPENWRELAIKSSPVVQQAEREAEQAALDEERKKQERSERARKAAEARKAKKVGN